MKKTKILQIITKSIKTKVITGVVALAVVGGSAATVVMYQNNERNKEIKVTAEKNIEKNREREESAISAKKDEGSATTAATTVAESTSKPEENKQTENANTTTANQADNTNTTTSNASSTNTQQQQTTNQENQKQEQKAAQPVQQQQQNTQKPAPAPQPAPQKPAAQPTQQPPASQPQPAQPAPQPTKPSRPSGVDRAKSDEISSKLTKQNWTDKVRPGYDSKLNDLIQSAINISQGSGPLDSIKQSWDIGPYESMKGLHYVASAVNKVWMGNSPADYYTQSPDCQINKQRFNYDVAYWDSAKNGYWVYYVTIGL